MKTKKEVILKVAERLFAQLGYRGTTVREIAKQAHVNVAMISYYFGSKRDLLRELTFYHSLDIQKELQQILDGEGDYLSKIDLLIANIITWVHKNRRTHKIINSEYNKALHNEEFQHFVTERRKNFLMIENFIKEGQLAGAFSKSVNIPLLESTIFGGYFNLYYNQRLYKSLYDPEETRDFETLVHEDLIPHLQRIAKAILTYEV